MKAPGTVWVYSVTDHIPKDIADKFAKFDLYLSSVGITHWADDPNPNNPLATAICATNPIHTMPAFITLEYTATRIIEDSRLTNTPVRSSWRQWAYNTTTGLLNLANTKIGRTCCEVPILENEKDLALELLGAVI